MGELNTDLLSLTMRKLTDLLQTPLAFYLRILPNSRILRCDSPFWDDGCSFDYGEARATGDDAAEMGEVPGCVMAVDGGVLAERGEHDSVLEGEPADLEGCEELWDCGTVGLWVRGGAAGWLLGGGEIGDLFRQLGEDVGGRETYTFRTFVGDAGIFGLGVLLGDGGVC